MHHFRSLLIVFLALLPWLPAQWPFVPLHAVAHFIPVLLVVWVSLSRRQWLALLALVLLQHGPTLPDRTVEGTSITVTTANLLAFQWDMKPSIEAALSGDADVLVVQELTPAGQAALLQRMGADYPHRLEHPAQGAFGLGIYSRLPLEDAHVFERAGLPVGYARVAGIDVYAIHTLPPGTMDMARIRNHHIAELSSLAHATRGPLLMVGDFNATPTDPALHALRDAGLANASERCGKPTLTWSPFPGPPLLKLDHQFANGAIRCSRTWTTANPGSDHRPVHTTWTLPHSSALASGAASTVTASTHR